MHLETDGLDANLNDMSIDLIPASLEQDIDVIARRYRKAGGMGIQVLNLVVGHAENLMERLPDPVKDH